MNKYKLFSLLTLISLMTSGVSIAQEQAYSSIPSSDASAPTVANPPADVTLAFTRDSHGNYAVSGSTEKLILKKGQQWTVAVDNPDSYFKLGSPVSQATIYYIPNVSYQLKAVKAGYNLGITYWDPTGEYTHRNEESILDTEGGSINFHFVAATPGEQRVTFYFNDFTPLRQMNPKYSWRKNEYIQANNIENQAVRLGGVQEQASFTIDVEVQE